jgi:hypothetical protein
LESEIPVGVTPGNSVTDRNVPNTRQLTNLLRGFAVVFNDLPRRFPHMHHWHVHRQHIVRVEAGLGGFQGKQGLDSGARGGDQDERSGDLHNRKDPQLPAVGAGDASTRAGKGQPAFAARGRQTRDECQ